MSSIASNLDRIEFQSGVDATRLLGAYDKAEERLREARAAVEDNPTVERCREYVNASDALHAMIAKSAKWGTAA